MTATLPPVARAKLAELERLANDALALVNSAQSEVTRLRETIPGLLNWRDTTDPETAEGKIRQIALDECEDAINRNSALAAERRGRAATHRQVVLQIREWLGQLPASTQFAAVTIKPDLREGESVASAVNRVRADMSVCVRELTAMLTAPYPLPELLAQAQDRVNDLAGRGRPQVKVIGGRVTINTTPEGAWPLSYDAVAAVAAWANRDAILAAFSREIENMPRIGEAIGAEERARREARLRAELLALEYAEEAIIESGLATGADLSRRPDASPAAVLGVNVLGASAARAA